MDCFFFSSSSRHNIPEMSGVLTNDEGDLRSKCVENGSNQCDDDTASTDYEEMCLLPKDDFHMNSEHLTEGDTDEYLMEVSALNQSRCMAIAIDELFSDDSSLSSKAHAQAIRSDQ